MGTRAIQSLKKMLAVIVQFRLRQPKHRHLPPQKVVRKAQLMSNHAQAIATHTKSNATLTFTPIQPGGLQLKCACGQHTIAGEECEECRKNREGTLQRAAVTAAPVNTVPPIVQDVLNSPGK